MTDWRGAIEAYSSHRTSFIVGLPPPEAVGLSAREALEIWRARHGPIVDLALSPTRTDPGRPIWDLDPQLRGPVARHSAPGWIRSANVVGVNIRTVGTYFGVAKYALTLPACHDAVHLLPIWEPGVVDSLYGMCSWEINDEWLDPELAALYPHLGDASRQLRALINLLHVDSRAVGMDVIPHTDRYSEMALCHPEHFEWLRRDDRMIVDHRADLHEEVCGHVFEFVVNHGPACRDARIRLASVDDLFCDAVDEVTRRRVIVGEAADRAGREARRIALVKSLHARGFEPVPATMAPPYRGLTVDERPETTTTDEHGMCWRDFRITRPEPMSRVFGPLARYKLYGRLDNNAEWAIDFGTPREPAWRYICERYGEVQRRFGFDFMRGDMSHVQMRSDGVPISADAHYDPMAAIKAHIRQHNHAPYFAYFAESFLAPPSTMGYGDEIDHLELSDAEITLGDLQSMTVGTAEYMSALRRYLDIGATRAVAPCLTVMTGDKDDPRFDAFYRHGNTWRMFVALFVGDLPSYVGLGFELRDLHLTPAPNEHYTKLYVFQQRRGHNATYGPYVWGHNFDLFDRLTHLREQADVIVPALRGHATRWLCPPDATAAHPVVAWTQRDDPRWVFVANSAERDVVNISVPTIPRLGDHQRLGLRWSSGSLGVRAHDSLPFNRFQHRIDQLGAGECRIYDLSVGPNAFTDESRAGPDPK